MVTEDRISSWERREEFMSAELSRLARELEKSEDKTGTIKQELNDLKLEMSRAVDGLSIKLAETNAKLKVQGRYAWFMISTLVPANIALLYKIFMG